MYKYTLAFIKNKNKILMLNRNKSPWLGSWNGVGGKRNENELPIDCIQREIQEETGLIIDKSSILYKGVVVWDNNDNYNGGLHVYLVEIDNDSNSYPRVVDEGILEWKEIDWVSRKDNYGVAHNIPYFIDDVLYNNKKFKFYCEFTKEELVKVTKTEI